jgi:Uma2 family endonuclease
MATALRTSLEEYLRSHYEPECELIGGELFQKPMGTLEHMRMERRLAEILARYEHEGLGEVIHELSVLKGDDVRIPDVVFAPQGAQFQNGILVESPLLCVEILSPSQRPSELFAKCEAYHAWDVPYCWIIDPVKKLAWEYHRDSPVQLIPPAGSLQAGEIAVHCNELFV